MTIGRSAGTKTCDDCGTEYAGPAYRTFSPDECKFRFGLEHRCTENLCPQCADEPDRRDDPRRLTRGQGRSL